MTQEEHIQQTVEKSITAFWDHEKRQSSSIAEFLYSQFLFIRKRWWILQLGCLLLLWLILNMGFSQVVERKAIAIIIPVFTGQWERHGVDKFKKICKISFCFRYITFLLQILIFFNEYVMVKNPGF